MGQRQLDVGSTARRARRVPAATVTTHHNLPTSGHLGVSKTIGAPTPDYYWDTLRRDVGRDVRICATCQRQKAARHFRYGTQYNLASVAAWEYVSIDAAGPFSSRSRARNTYIVVVVDNFSNKRLATRHAEPDDRGRCGAARRTLRRVRRARAVAFRPRLELSLRHRH